MKFTREGGTVSVSTESFYGSGKASLKISITDTGTGIYEEKYIHFSSPENHSFTNTS